MAYLIRPTGTGTANQQILETRPLTRTLRGDDKALTK